MNIRAKIFVAFICSAGITAFFMASTQVDWSATPTLLGWFSLQLVSGVFWMEMRESNVTTRFGTSLRIAIVCAIGPWATILTAFSELLIEGFFFQNKPWYKTLFNASQVAVCVFGAGIILVQLGGFPAGGLLSLPNWQGVVKEQFLLNWGILWLVAAIVAYGITNTAMMATLIRQLTPVRLVDAWKRGASGVPNIFETSLNVLLFFILVETLGVSGIIVFLGIPALEHFAKKRRFDLINAQEELVQTERLVAVGEIAEEMASSMKENLSELTQSTRKLEDNPNSQVTEKLRKGVRTIRENLGHMRTLVDGLSQFSDRNSRVEKVNLNLLSEKTLEFVRSQNRFDKIQIQFCSEATPPLVNVAPGRIQQVMINLLANAADAIHDANVERGRIDMTTRWNPLTGKVQVLVVDNGPGIPEDSLNKIFEPQYTTKAAGHGFGLSVAFRIAKDFHGDLRVYNRPEGGAEFCLELPAA